MKHLIACLLAARVMSATGSSAVEPTYREVQATLTYGLSTPTEDWKARMENGQSLALDLGMAVSSRATVGFHFGIGVFDAKIKQLGALNASVDQHDWTRYSGGIFGEYRLTASRVAPFVGANLGVYGVHIAYDEVIEGFDGQGHFGFGFGISAGLQYRGDQPVGAILRFDAENPRGVIDGWFYQAQVGLRAFL